LRETAALSEAEAFLPQKSKTPYTEKKKTGRQDRLPVPFI